MAKMSFLTLVFGIWMVSFAGALDFAQITNVLAPQIKTVPPKDGVNNVQYVETVFKATDHQTQVHTVEPLQPSYEVKFQSTTLTTINNQTISTQASEFATILNTTVLYFTDGVDNYTYNGAATYYQTIEFATQKVTYTPVTDSATTAVTVTETNALGFW